jgi:hydrogenase maturation factor HypE
MTKEVAKKTKAPKVVNQDVAEEVTKEVVKDVAEDKKDFVTTYRDKQIELNSIFDEEIFTEIQKILAKISKVGEELNEIKKERVKQSIPNLEMKTLVEVRKVKVPMLKDGEKQYVLKTLQSIMKMKR